jgi:hypothetical protein
MVEAVQEKVEVGAAPAAGFEPEVLAFCCEH